MLSLLKNERKEFQKKLLEAIKEYEYHFERYDVSYSVSIAYLPESIDAVSISGRIRKSDRYIRLHDNLHAVVFDYTDDVDGLKAANKLLTYFQVEHFGKSLYAAIVTASHEKTPAEIITELFDLLAYSIEHNMDNHVMDASQVMRGM